MVSRLGVTRAESMGIVQRVPIGPSEAVCRAKDAVVIGRVC